MDRIGEVAIQAVRAFPQLPWAFVDLVVRDAESAKAPIYVEKMQRDAYLSSTNNVFAGGMEEVFQFLFSAAPVREKIPKELLERLSSAPA